MYLFTGKFNLAFCMGYASSADSVVADIPVCLVFKYSGPSDLGRVLVSQEGPGIIAVCIGISVKYLDCFHNFSSFEVVCWSVFVFYMCACSHAATAASMISITGIPILNRGFRVL